MTGDSAIVPSSGAIPRQRAGKYLTFKLGAEEYRLEILKVREIIGLMSITSVPRTPSYVRGVINLRGKVILVLDLRRKFGMDSAADTDQSCIIVVDVASSGDSILMGLLVDAVSEVLDIGAEEIQDAPEFGAQINTDFILGIGRVKGAIKLLLDIDRVTVESQTGANSASDNQPDTCLASRDTFPIVKTAVG
ncbi:MAG: purine-binding chemotaxis protein CheW [bacterium]|jgi:purine-binding chemotaxis protein CheW